MVGTMTPLMPGWAANQSISATERSMLWVIGTSAMPPWRSGLRLHISARKRLWARAPAKASSGSVMDPAERPAPNGGEDIPVIASASANITSAVTPSASSSLSRWSMSHAPRRPSAFSVSHPMM